MNRAGPGRLATLSSVVSGAAAIAAIVIVWTNNATADAAVETSSVPSADLGATEEMVVTASHGPRSRESVPSLTTVIEAEEISSSVSTSVADLLRFVPGIVLTQDGARGGRSSLSLRGLDPNHVVVLIDGVRLNDPTNSRGGSFDPTTLALIDIERIEIIRGPQSAIYGSDALAGAINILTKRVQADDAAKASVRARGGRFHAANIVAEASSGIGGVAGLSIGAGLDTFRDPESDGGYDGVSAKAKLDVRLPGAIDLEAFARIHESSARSFPNSSGGPELAGLREMEDRDVREILFGLVFDREWGELAGLNIRMSRVSRREDLDSPGIDPEPNDPFNFNLVPPSLAGDEYRRWDLAMASRWNLPELDVGNFEIESRLIGGVDFVWENGESDTYLDFGGGPTRFPFFDRRRTIGVFAELEEQIGPHVVASAGVRFDSTPDENDYVSPSVGLSIDIPKTPITILGNYGEGFKRPSFYALGNPLVGNARLQLEESRGWEAGVRVRSDDGRHSGQISYFDIEVKDIIDFDSAAFVLRNRSRLLSRGVELDLQSEPVDWLRWSGGATFNNTDFKGTSQEPENRPRWRGFGTLTLIPVESIELTVRVLAVSAAKASSFQTGSRVITLQSYERVDARVGWLATEILEVFLEIENLTNRTYREAVGFESPGIAPRVGLVLRR